MRASATILLLLGTALLPAQAPPGFRTYVEPGTGLRFFSPKGFKEVPTQPTEKVIRARFETIKLPSKPQRVKGRLVRPTPARIYVFMFQEGQTTPGKSGTKEDAGPRTLKEAVERGGAVSSWDEFRKKRLRGLKVLREKKGRDFFKLRAGESDVGYAGFVRSPPFLLGAYGFQGTTDKKRFRSIVRRMVKSLSLAAGKEGADRAEASIERIYKGKSWRGIEQRKAIRRDLPRGWKAHDTENYIIVHHTRNPALIKRLARDLETMRSHFAKRFPPMAGIDAVSLVRICRNRKEYGQYGGPPYSLGYWNPAAEELVSFDFLQTFKETDHRYKGPRLSNKNSLETLYHEVFHQYIYFATGRLAPHYWFNEGMADYYSGARIPRSGGEIKTIKPSRLRIELAKRQCKEKKGFIPLNRLLHAERKEYYDQRRIGLYYAAGWSFCYFLRASKAARENPVWGSLPERYHEALKEAHALELQLLGENAPLKEKQKAGARARAKAIKKALEDVDVAAMESAWVRYISRLKNPYPPRKRR